MAQSSPESNQTSALASMAGLKNKKSQLPRDFIGTPGHGDLAIAVPSTLNVNHSFDEILVFARNTNASDVHLTVNHPITFRKFGSLQSQTKEILTADAIQNKVQSALTHEQLAEFLDKGDLEIVYTIKGAGRFRMTIMKQRHGWDLTARVIPMTITPFEKSGMPKSCQNLTKWAQGLVLITGPAGCGKTTTLSTIVEMINQTRHDHIITIEEPIEIVYEAKSCQITQREINRHTLSQANALRAALREDPDIIVVSELRDYETIQLAVSAAETGHLVLGTMNTKNAFETIFNLINSFPAEEQTIIANMISESLRGVLCQQLIPKKDGSGVVPAYEVLLHNSAIGNMIRKGDIQQINNVITMGKAAGMVLFDNSLQDLVNQGVIDGEEAFYRAINPNTFKQFSGA